jgi:hypothetical protein
MDSPIAFANGTVVALVHTEYPGGVYNNTGPSPPECAGLAPDGSGKAKNCAHLTARVHAYYMRSRVNRTYLAP